MGLHRIRGFRARNDEGITAISPRAKILHEGNMDHRRWGTLLYVTSVELLAEAESDPDASIKWQ